MPRGSFFSVVLLCAALIEASANAEEIYKWRDSKGNITYSTSPPTPQAAPVELPRIGREDLDRKLERIRENTIPNCRQHGDVDCSKGPDKDGSVICLDGFRDALKPFRFACLEARLSAEYRVEIIQDMPKELPLKEAIKTLSGHGQVRRIYASVRNKSAVKALDVKLELKFPTEPSYFPFAGPSEVEPFGLADYSIHLSEAITKRELGRLQLRLRCANCP